jgi:hypothetical protein
MFDYFMTEAKRRYTDYLEGKNRCKPKRIQKTRKQLYRDYYNNIPNAYVNREK